MDTDNNTNRRKYLLANNTGKKKIAKNTNIGKNFL